jgi:hypothetical protein
MTYVKRFKPFHQDPTEVVEAHHYDALVIECDRLRKELAASQALQADAARFRYVLARTGHRDGVVFTLQDGDFGEILGPDEAIKAIDSAMASEANTLAVEAPRGMWPIWVEGYQATGQAEKARYLGSAEGATFDEAVEAFLLTPAAGDIANYGRDKHGVWRCWGCRLTASEQQARSTFG